VTVFESHHEEIESGQEKFKFMVNELVPLLFQSSFIPKESISFKYVSTPPYTLPTDVFNNSYGYILENLRVKSGIVPTNIPFISSNIFRRRYLTRDGVSTLFTTFVAFG